MVPVSMGAVARVIAIERQDSRGWREPGTWAKNSEPPLAARQVMPTSGGGCVPFPWRGWAWHIDTGV